LQEHVRGVTAVKFSSSGEQLFSAGMDNVLNVWQVNDAFRDPDFEGVSDWSQSGAREPLWLLPNARCTT
jgi:hypothetical protein